MANKEKEVVVNAEVIEPVETPESTPVVEVPSIADRKANVKAEIDTLIAGYNAASTVGAETRMSRLSTELEKKLDSYNQLCWDEYVDAIKGEADPMIRAIRDLVYEVGVIKDESRGKKKMISKKVFDTSVARIDPEELQEDLGVDIGASTDWLSDLKTLNVIMTGRVGMKLGFNPADIIKSYKIRQQMLKLEAFGFKDGNFNDVVADEVVRDNFEKVISDMIGEEPRIKEFDDHLAFYINSVYAKKSRRALELTCSNHASFKALMMEVCYYVLTGADFSVKYKKANI